jgi:hypothetical protein
MSFIDTMHKSLDTVGKAPLIIEVHGKNLVEVSGDGFEDTQPFE